MSGSTLNLIVDTRSQNGSNPHSDAAGHPVGL